MDGAKEDTKFIPITSDHEENHSVPVFKKVQNSKTHKLGTFVVIGFLLAWMTWITITTQASEEKRQHQVFQPASQPGNNSVAVFEDERDKRSLVLEGLDNIVLSSTAGAAEYFGDRLGEFVRMGDYYNNRPYYKQRETEEQRDLYLYYMTDDRWWVGSTLGKSQGGLYNTQDTILPPKANWLYWNGKKWSDDDQTLKLDYTTLSSPCELVRVAGSGRVLDHEPGSMGYYRLQEGRWSAGRPVYKKGSGSTALFLLVKWGLSSWGIMSSTTSTRSWIESGRATTSPTSSRAGASRRWGVTRWRYQNNGWKEGDISITCN